MHAIKLGRKGAYYIIGLSFNNEALQSIVVAGKVSYFGRFYSPQTASASVARIAPL